jgi:hypothetical protein
MLTDIDRFYDFQIIPDFILFPIAVEFVTWNDVITIIQTVQLIEIGSFYLAYLLQQ